MDRNSIIGFVLIAGIFIVWGILSKPSEEEQARLQRYNDSIALVREQNAELERQLNEARTNELEAEKRKNDSLKLENKKAELGVFVEALNGEKEFFVLENEKIALEVSTLGGRPYSVNLKEYQTYDSLPLVLFDGDSTQFGMDFFNKGQHVSTNDLFFTANEQQKRKVVSTSPGSLSMRLLVDTNKYIEYVYTLSPNSYQVDMQVKIVGLQEIGTGSSQSTIDFNWAYYSPKHEKGWKNESYYTTMYFKPKGEEVDYFNGRTKKDYTDEDLFTPVEWIAYKDQFFSSVLMADNNFESAIVKMTTMPEDSKHVRYFDSDIKLAYKHSPNETLNMSFYFGPNDFKYLKKNYGDKQLHDLVTVGRSLIKWINQYVIINIFNWLSKYIANYGIIILLLTLIIKSALMPFTFKSFMSQAKMRVLKPMIDEATAKIPKDKQMERQQATMAIYKKVGVSPMGGCLPMILQMPILYAMFRFFPLSIELRQQSFLWATDLSSYDAIFEWTKQIPFISEYYGNHISLFTILMTVTTVLSMQMNNSAQSSQQMPGMKGMMYIMPVMFMVFLNNFSAGLTYYYFLANMITLGQNLLFKQFIDEEALLAKLKAKNVKPKKKSKWQARLEEMQKMQQQQAKKRK